MNPSWEPPKSLAATWTPAFGRGHELCDPRDLLGLPSDQQQDIAKLHGRLPVELWANFKIMGSSFKTGSTTPGDPAFPATGVEFHHFLLFWAPNFSCRAVYTSHENSSWMKIHIVKMVIYRIKFEYLRSPHYILFKSPISWSPADSHRTCGK